MQYLAAINSLIFEAFQMADNTNRLTFANRNVKNSENYQFISQKESLCEFCLLHLLGN